MDWSRRQWLTSIAGAGACGVFSRFGLSAEQHRLKHTSIPATGKTPFEPAADEASLPDRFQQLSHEFLFQTTPWQSWHAVAAHRVTFPSPMVTQLEINNTVHTEYFQPAGEGPFPAAVVLHILGGDFPLSRTICLHLARNGIAAMFVKLPYYGERRGNQPRRMVSRDPAESLEGFTQAVLDIRRAAAWLRARPEVNPERVGITGISLGGITTALAAGVESRFSHAGVVLGGGNFADFLWKADVKEARQFRQKWVEDGKTAEEFAALLEPIDPVTYGPRLKDRQVLMVLAKHDEVIPPANGLALWKSMGEPNNLVWLDSGHYTAAYYLPRELCRLHLFFQNRKCV